jgi:phosphotransferase system HPr (HPr) family protein
MNGEILRQKVRISNLQGLHIRPATAFVELARQFQSSVFVTKEGQRVDAKLSPLELLLLGALQGTELSLEASGPDAQAALTALAAFLDDLIHEDVEEQPPLPPKG